MRNSLLRNFIAIFGILLLLVSVFAYIRGDGGKTPDQVDIATLVSEINANTIQKMTTKQYHHHYTKKYEN